MSRPARISTIILWSVISAAFIGPGTVTTAVTAGSHFHLDLLWAVVFATLACIVLQEVSARITIASGLSLGQAVIRKFGAQKGKGLNLFVGASVILGCAAYEAGNILGAVSGLNLVVEGDGRYYTALITLIAAIILWSGRQQWISTLMTLLVGLMGIAFLVLALHGNFSVSEILIASVVPRFPAGSELIALGLVGTTIVPYNVFLGSGISKGQTVPLMRVGLTVSVVVGGLITAWILLAGTLVNDFTSFPTLAGEFQTKIGTVGAVALGVGLFAAGFSSAITSPYAASVIATTVFGAEKASQVRWVWSCVLLTGFLFGISGVKPVPVILTVQALNGLILPLITVYLIYIVNDPLLIPKAQRHGPLYNLLLLIILGSVLLIGLTSIDKSVSTFMNFSSGHFGAIWVLTLAVLAWVGFQVFTKKPGAP